MNTPTYRSGFVHILGLPNVGKSTMINNLIKYPLSITTHKPQTTRHNIVGIDQDTHRQIIYVDTPGYLTPNYALQKVMMNNVGRALVDSDILLWIVDIRHTEKEDHYFSKNIHTLSMPCILLLNKLDLIDPDKLAIYQAQWQARIPKNMEIIPMSAINPKDVNKLSATIKNLIPTHPPYYEKGTLTDKPMRFLAADILRKSLLTHYKQEIPYSTEVVIDTFKEKEHSIYISITLYVERNSQKGIIIGQKGQKLKKTGITARKNLEIFFKKKIFLKQYVKVLPNWRHNKDILAKLGYL